MEQAVRELRQAIERLNKLNQQYDEGSYMSAAQFTEQWRSADEQYRAAADNLRTLGIEDEQDLELAVAQLANPNYREPAGLGFVVVDDADLDAFPAHELDVGID